MELGDGFQQHRVEHGPRRRQLPRGAILRNRNPKNRKADLDGVAVSYDVCDDREAP